MYEKNGKAHTFTCDDGKSKGCEGEFEASSTDFREAVEELKEEGWTIINAAGEYEHFCRACSKDGLEVTF